MYITIMQYKVRTLEFVDVIYKICTIKPKRCSWHSGKSGKLSLLLSYSGESPRLSKCIYFASRSSICVWTKLACSSRFLGFGLVLTMSNHSNCLAWYMACSDSLHLRSHPTQSKEIIIWLLG